MAEKQSEFYEDLVAAVYDDFKKRQEERRAIEKQWELDLEYLAGNQYVEIAPNGEVEEEEKYFFWQNRNAYNHIAPIVDSRIARLTRARPVMSVRASSGDESDLKTAKLTTEILNATYQRIDLGKVIGEATRWSEACGTSFYEICWMKNEGRYLGECDGKSVYEGDVSVRALSPFEIFPDSLASESLDDCKSVIHARAMHVSDVERCYGVKLVGRDVDVFSLSVAGAGSGKTSGVRHDNVLVIEKFERPSSEYPNGRVIAVAENTLLYLGELPYRNGTDGARDFPFVRQISIGRPGCFFGSSIVERVIPVQRAYNAVKNRKQEFLNRISMGVVTVEDGSVDTDDLAEEGLSPGKVIVYRQGARPPAMMATGNVPTDFAYEEERLLNEFVMISGVSELSRSSTVGSNFSSGLALQLLIEQDDTRLSATTENVRRAVRLVAKHILRLFKQYAGKRRLMRSAGDNGKVEMFFFSSSDLSSDDVVFDTENELSYTPAQKKSAVYELIGSGLLSDETGKLGERTKTKVLEILGFGSVANMRDLEDLHTEKAGEENLSGFADAIEPDEYDDHEIHIAEHTRYLLSSESAKTRANKATRENALAHLRKHKAALASGKLVAPDSGKKENGENAAGEKGAVNGTEEKKS